MTTAKITNLRTELMRPFRYDFGSKCGTKVTSGGDLKLDNEGAKIVWNNHFKCWVKTQTSVKAEVENIGEEDAKTEIYFTVTTQKIPFRLMVHNDGLYEGDHVEKGGRYWTDWCAVTPKFLEYYGHDTSMSKKPTQMEYDFDHASVKTANLEPLKAPKSVKYTASRFAKRVLGIEDATVVKEFGIRADALCGNYDHSQWSVKLLSGDDVAPNYGFVGSCMGYKESRPYVNFYGHNVGTCWLVLLESKDGRVKGRTVLWKNMDGVFMIDRAYSTGYDAAAVTDIMMAKIPGLLKKDPHAKLKGEPVIHQIYYDFASEPMAPIQARWQKNLALPWFDTLSTLWIPRHAPVVEDSVLFIMPGERYDGKKGKLTMKQYGDIACKRLGVDPKDKDKKFYVYKGMDRAGGSFMNNPHKYWCKDCGEHMNTRSQTYMIRGQNLSATAIKDPNRCRDATVCMGCLGTKNYSHVNGHYIPAADVVEHDGVAIDRMHPPEGYVAEQIAVKGRKTKLDIHLAIPVYNPDQPGVVKYHIHPDHKAKYTRSARLGKLFTSKVAATRAELKADKVANIWAVI